MTATTESLLQYVVPAVLGLVGGAIGSIVAPWSNWGVETRRKRLENRHNFIVEARNAVTTAEGVRDFRETDTYVRLQPHLSEKTLEWLVRDEREVVPSGGDNFKQHAYADIDRLEQRWGLL